MTQKFLLFVGLVLILLGAFFLMIGLSGGNDVINNMMQIGGLWRTAMAFALFSGAIHLLFAGLRKGGDLVMWFSPIAFCEAMMGMTLVGNPIPFAEHASGGNAGLFMGFIGAMLIGNGLTIFRVEGRTVSQKACAA